MDDSNPAMAPKMKSKYWS